MRKGWLIWILALLLMFTLWGCAAKSAGAASGDTATTEMAAEVPAAEPEAMAMATYDADISYAGGGESGSSFSQNYGGHKVISTYEMELRTDAFDSHYEALVSKAKTMGGYVQYGNVWGTKPEVYGDSGRTAELTFRIPAEQAEAFLTFAEGNGEVVRQSVNTEDVTLDYYDRETRLEVLRTQLDRLQSILVETDNLADIIQLEQAISDVTLEIEQMTTQLRRYDDLIDYATVHIYLYEESLIAGPAATKGFGERVSEGFRSNLSGVGVFLENSLVWLISALPVLVLLAVIALVVILIVRAICRKRKNKQDPNKNNRPASSAPWKLPEKKTEDDHGKKE